jgi:hypothetical protein
MAKRGEYSFGPAGTRLWTAVTKDHLLEAHERALLVELCRTIDTAETLQAAVDKAGVSGLRSVPPGGMA